MKYIELKNLARKTFPCKIFQGKNFLARSFKENISLQDLSRKKFPCKIFQGNRFLARSFKENISLQDLARNKFPCKILQVIAFLQGSCKILARNAFFLDQGTLWCNPKSFKKSRIVPKKKWGYGGILRVISRFWTSVLFFFSFWTRF